MLARHAAVVLALLALPAIAQEPASIRFAHNASAAELVGSVVRGERALYTLEARAGQTLVARITSAEDNAGHCQVSPGWRWGDEQAKLTG